MELVPARYERHIFVCINEKWQNDANASGYLELIDDCCAKRIETDAQGVRQCIPEQILKRLREHVNSKGLMHKYNITKTKCLGHCKEGPTIAVYPEGFIFRKVSMDDTDKIIKEFLQ